MSIVAKVEPESSHGDVVGRCARRDLFRGGTHLCMLLILVLGPVGRDHRVGRIRVAGGRCFNARLPAAAIQIWSSSAAVPDVY
jgi:hypothetical protein